MPAGPRCPKCHSGDFTAYATDECEVSAQVKGGEVVTCWAESALPFRIALHGVCRCGHTWRFKAAHAL